MNNNFEILVTFSEQEERYLFRARRKVTPSYNCRGGMTQNKESCCFASPCSFITSEPFYALQWRAFSTSSSSRAEKLVCTGLAAFFAGLAGCSGSCGGRGSSIGAIRARLDDGPYTVAPKGQTETFMPGERNLSW